ncbi:Fe-S protein assembly co-chaperone HscB [Pasteurellaceae bacterium RH1A]|nr:Fe-S protein assembly co-chaperone HscB [Pasteurellaceae bacterium RH1A]
MSNPFELFDLPVAFEIDQAVLSERYLALQKSLHPDNFASHSAQDQRIAMQKSTEVNDAQKILKDPILRAETIIALNTGLTHDPEQKSNRDVAFLMQQLEWREALNGIENSQDEAALEDFTQQIKAEQKQMIAELTLSLNNQDWQEADGLCDKLRFVKKLMVEIERVEDKIFEG